MLQRSNATQRAFQGLCVCGKSGQGASWKQCRRNGENVFAKGRIKVVFVLFIFLLLLLLQGMEEKIGTNFKT